MVKNKKLKLTPMVLGGKVKCMTNMSQAVALLVMSFVFSAKVLASPLTSGFSFAQVDFTYPSATELNSPYGQIFLDYSQIPGSGYVNVKTSAGWAVQNLPVLGGSGLPGVSMMFDLGFTGPQVAPFEAYVDYSPVPLADNSTLTGSPQSFGLLNHVEHNPGGSGGPITSPQENPAGKMTVTFDPNGITTLPIINTIRRSVEQVNNQCGPAAVANSLAYLKERYGVALKHEHIPGNLGNPPSSLVGQLDNFSDWNAIDGVFRANLLDGKLKYLDKNGPKNLIIKHQGVFDFKNKSEIPAADRTQGATTSNYQGNLVTIDFLMQEIHNGEDIEMDLTFGGRNGPGHEIMITGGDFILGRPWVTFVHDAVQGNNTKGTGLFDGGYGFAWLDDPGGGGFLQLKGYVIGYDGLAAGVRNVITESVPEPATSGLIVLGLVIIPFFRPMKLWWSK